MILLLLSLICEMSILPDTNAVRPLPITPTEQTTEINNNTFPAPTTLDNMTEKPKETNKETLSPREDSIIDDMIKKSGYTYYPKPKQDTLEVAPAYNSNFIQESKKDSIIVPVTHIKIPVYVDIIVNTALGLLALLVVF